MDLPEQVKNTDFKAIIIGGGPVGLAVAHSLHLAGIDFVLYERSDVIGEPRGAALAIQPNNVRLLDQWGMLDEARRLAPPMRWHRNLDRQGKLLNQFPWFAWLVENHGDTMMLFERYELMRTMYESIAHVPRYVRAGKNFQTLQVFPDRVRVTFADGTSDEGDIVVGADGGHSHVRNALRDGFTFPSAYICLYGIGDIPSGMEVGVIREIGHPEGSWAFQIFTTPGRVFWLIYKALERPTTERRTFTEAETDDFAERYHDFDVGCGLTFCDLRRKKWRETLGLLEEGVFDRWYQDRIVLVGDAAHKITPNLAYNANSGWEDAVSLTNHLRSLLKKEPMPSTESLSLAFARYQAQREDLCRRYLAQTSQSLREMVGIEPAPVFQIDRAREFLDREVSPLIAQGIKLDFVALREKHHGNIPYRDELPSAQRLGVLLMWPLSLLRSWL